MSDGMTAMLEEGWHDYEDKYDQPPPMPNNYPAIGDLVLEDLKERCEVGKMRYGTALQPFNGREALLDLYQEQMDALLYLRQLMFELYGK